MTHGASRFFAVAFAISALVFLPQTTFARPGGGGGHPGGHPGGGQGMHHQGNPPGPQGGPGAGHRPGNPPGSMGGQGAGPAFHREGNPPGPMGGRGAGPLWKDNPNKIDNPPGPIGGRGTDWGNPPGPIGGQGTNWGNNPPGPQGGEGTNSGSPQGMEMRQHMKQMMKARFDTNHDGVLEPAEKMRAKEMFREHFGGPRPEQGSASTAQQNPAVEAQGSAQATTTVPATT